MRLRFRSLVALAAVLHAAVMMSSAFAGEFPVYIGTYTGGQSRGIYSAKFNSVDGRLTPVVLAAEAKNPSFLAATPDGRFLYAVAEINDFEGRRTGAVSAFRIESSNGKLTLLNQQASKGLGPTHLALDRSNRCVLVANYGSGSVAALPIREDGTLGQVTGFVQHQGSSVNPKRQSGPHAHFISTSPDNRFALACDLGLDKVLVYRLDLPSGNLTPNEPPFGVVPPGAGARHLAFHPNGRFAYVVNEMGSSITTFAYEAGHGGLRPVQTISMVPAEFKAETYGGEIQAHPSGKFVYGSNRGHDSIAVFSVDANTGKLAMLGCQPCGGKTPRHFTLDPTGQWLLVENQDSNNVVVFRIDPATGRLTKTDQEVNVGSPVCLIFTSPERR